jgi:hypothetical protein
MKLKILIALLVLSFATLSNAETLRNNQQKPANGFYQSILDLKPHVRNIIMSVVESNYGNKLDKIILPVTYKDGSNGDTLPVGLVPKNMYPKKIVITSLEKLPLPKKDDFKSKIMELAKKLPTYIEDKGYRLGFYVQFEDTAGYTADMAYIINYDFSLDRKSLVIARVYMSPIFSDAPNTEVYFVPFRNMKKGDFAEVNDKEKMLYFIRSKSAEPSELQRLYKEGKLKGIYVFSFMKQWVTPIAEQSFLLTNDSSNNLIDARKPATIQLKNSFWPISVTNIPFYNNQVPASLKIMFSDAIFEKYSDLNLKYLKSVIDDINFKKERPLKKTILHSIPLGQIVVGG